MTDTNPSDDELDLATARRLRRLSTLPVDLNALEARIAADIPKPPAGTRRPAFLRPLFAVAASLVVMTSLTGVVLLSLPRPVIASTAVLTDLYLHSPTGITPASPDAPPMPCCVRQVEGKNVTCLAMTIAGKRVMMAVGDGRHFKVPDSAGRRTIDGVEYRFQSSGNVNMAMAVKNGAWICLMGEPDVDSLLTALSRLDAKQPPSAPSR